MTFPKPTLLALISAIFCTSCITFADNSEPVTEFEFFPEATIWKQEGSQLTLPKQAKRKKPKVRRPASYALIPGEWTDFELTLEAKSLRPTTFKGRDICVIFGFQNDEEFYYAHLSNDSNAKVHNVMMLVGKEDRKTIQSPKKPTPTLEEEWHTFKIVRQGDSITVYADDMNSPLMTANDATYGSGRIAVGTFDDPAMFRNIYIKGL